MLLIRSTEIVKKKALAMRGLGKRCPVRKSGVRYAEGRWIALDTRLELTLKVYKSSSSGFVPMICVMRRRFISKTHAFIEGMVRPMEYTRRSKPARTRARLRRRVAQPLGGDLSGS
jgi:hypothetical protein